MTTFTVVVNTYNRRSLLGRALASVLAQDFDDYEVVVADDGSTDGTDEFVADYGDQRVRYVRQDNAGLSAARNLGAAAAAGDYLVWLDDDDEVEPTWLTSLHAADPDGLSAVLCVGARIVENDGATVTRVPADLGPAFDHRVGLFLPGSFAVRRDAFDAVGGFWVGLGCSHQTELALRLLPLCTERGWSVASRSEVGLIMHRARPAERGRNRAARLLECTESLIERHGERLARDPSLLASYLSIAGVSAARSGDYRGARAWFSRALRARPGVKGAGRWLLARLPSIGRRVWAR